MSQHGAQSQQGPSYTLLLVDDEPNILTALKRLFRPEGYRILTAESGPVALSLLEKERIDLLISDMRMPEMDGAQLLQEVAKRWPSISRILLTGYADLDSTIRAINEGHVERYISKPWEDSEIKLTVRHALEQVYLRRERARLLKLTRKQNAELKELNANLEQRVRARTEEIQQTADMLDLAYQELKRSYVQAIPIFSNLIEMREGRTEGHGRRVGEQAGEVARVMGMEEEAAEQVYFAGLLHDVGKLALPDELLEKPFESLTASERRQVERHPAMGQAALTALEPLAPAAKFIRHHHERWDGAGFPDRLAGENIPLGARILTVVSEFDALQLGTLLDKSLPPREAKAFLEAHKGKRYDPDVVDAFLRWLDEHPEQTLKVSELHVSSKDLEPGMVLARDLIGEQGILLLAKGYQIDEKVITRIRNLERDENRGFTLFVRLPEEDEDAAEQP